MGGIQQGSVQIAENDRVLLSFHVFIISDFPESGNALLSIHVRREAKVRIKTKRRCVSDAETPGILQTRVRRRDEREKIRQKALKCKIMVDFLTSFSIILNGRSEKLQKGELDAKNSSS